jgi:5-methylcytosine-specific restriction endonuclease McrA
MICSIEGCGKPQLARKWCSKHYNRWYRYGDPLGVRPLLTPEARKATKRRWREQNPDNVTKWNAAHPERRKELSRKATAQYRATHPDRVRASEVKARLAHPEKDRAKGQRRRALIRDRTVEKFLDIEIFERDNWVCGICHEPIDPYLTIGPWKVELDHIKPISKGGNHTRDNVQAAHRWCNQRKGSK